MSLKLMIFIKKDNHDELRDCGGLSNHKYREIGLSATTMLPPCDAIKPGFNLLLDEQKATFR